MAVLHHHLLLPAEAYMSSNEKKVTTTAIISGQKVKVALPQDAKASSEKVKKLYSEALEYLKNK